MRIELDLLGLLVSEASDEAIRAAALVRPEGNRDLEQADVTANRVLRIRETIRELRRREAELMALNDTALDLVSMHTVRGVLDAIVRRARTLLGVDASYLTLVRQMDDVDGEGLLRVTSGIAHHDFRDLHAMGLGQLVLATGGPQFTADYFADDRFDHDQRVDDVVESEGLRAVLGVPLIMRDVSLGVLSVADRRQRDFATEEIVLLSALASLAAAAIENARLFEESSRVIAELEDAQRTIQQHADVLETVGTVHGQLTQLALDGADLDQVAAATAEWSGCHIRIEDAGGHAVATSSRAGSSLADDGSAVGDETDPREFPIVAGGRRLGTVIATNAVSLDSLRTQTLERASQVVALLLLNQQATLEAEQRRRNSLLRHLMDHSSDPEALRCQRAAHSGVNIGSPFRVAALRTADISREELLAASTALSRRSGLLVAEHEETLVILAPVEGMNVEALRAEVGQMWTGAVTGAWAGPARGASAVAGTVAEALRALKLMQALGRTGEISELREIGLYGLLFANANAVDLDEFVDTAIGPVLDYDRNHGTQLIRTLDAWYAHGGAVALSAATLHVHVNTLYKRMDRLDALLGDGWRAAEGALRAQLALRLHGLRISE